MDRFKHAPRFVRNLRWEHVLNTMLFLIALTIAGQTWYLHAADEANQQRVEAVAKEQVSDARAQADCLRDSIVGITDALNARLVPADIEREATRRLISGAITGPTEAEAAELVADYRKALKVADRLREETPVPEYPDGLCEKVGK